MRGLRHFLPLMVGGIVLHGGLCAQDTGAAPATNLRIYQLLATSLSDSLATGIPPGDSARVSVRISPADAAWYLQDAVERPFRQRKCVICAGDSGRYSAEFGAVSMSVRYTNVRKEGFFGSRVLDRSIVLAARMRIVDRMKGTVLTSGERQAEFADTVAVSGIEGLEQASIPATRGSVPPEDFLSGIAEPLVIVGAIAVAIFLLFTVRS